MDIYLIRHTRVDAVEGVCYGRSEVPLAASFAAEAESIRRQLPAAEPITYHSSPSLRCLRLARHLGGGEVRTAPELRELDFGAWELKPWDAIPREELDRWGRHYLEEACPGGESLRDLTGRVLPYFQGLVQGGDGIHVLVTHAGPIRVILASLLRLPPRELFSLRVDFGGVRRIRCAGGRAELEGVPGPSPSGTPSS